LYFANQDKGLILFWLLFEGCAMQYHSTAYDFREEIEGCEALFLKFLMKLTLDKKQLLENQKKKPFTA
jgi:hypothetical protein